MQLTRMSGSQAPYKGHTSLYDIQASDTNTEDDVREYVASEVGAIARAEDASWYGKRITRVEKSTKANHWLVTVHEPYTD
jgi:hypothetical protein